MISKKLLLIIFIFSLWLVPGLVQAQEDFALEFDGIDDYVLLPQINAGEEFTLEAWFYPTSLAAPWFTLFKDDWKGSNLGSIYLNPIGEQVDLSWWWQEKSMLVLYNLNLDTWYYFALVADGEEVTMHAITDRQSWQVSTSTTPNFNNELKIGETDEGSFFRGQIDQVKIYQRALTPEEIQEHFEQNYQNESGLLAEWNFDEGNGEIVYDKTENEYNGVVLGGTAYVVHPEEKEYLVEVIAEENVVTNEGFVKSLIKKFLLWFRNLF